MKRSVLIVAASLALVVSACAGDSGDADTANPTSTVTAGGADAGADPDSAGVTDDGTVDSNVIDDAEELVDDMVDAEGGTASVSIGDETWEFELFESIPMAVCDADFFGGFLAVLTSGSDLQAPLDLLSLTLPGGDFQDPPTLEVTISVDDDVKWVANEQIYDQSPDLPAGIGVTGFSIEGNTASGTAMFFEQESFYQFSAGLVEELNMAEGSFTVTCATG